MRRLGRLLVCVVLLVGPTGCQTLVSKPLTKNSSVTEPERIGVDFGDDPQNSVAGSLSGEASQRPYSASELAELPVGANCIVELKETDRLLTGTIESTGDTLLILRDANELFTHTAEAGVPMLNNVPYVSRMFKNTGRAVESRFLGHETLSATEIRSVLIAGEHPDEMIEISLATPAL